MKRIIKNILNAILFALAAPIVGVVVFPLMYIKHIYVLTKGGK
jgi:hypothetical protein